MQLHRARQYVILLNPPGLLKLLVDTHEGALGASGASFLKEDVRNGRLHILLDHESHMGAPVRHWVVWETDARDDLARHNHKCKDVYLDLDVVLEVHIELMSRLVLVLAHIVHCDMVVIRLPPAVGVLLTSLPDLLEVLNHLP